MHGLLLNTTSTYETLYDKIDDKFSGAEWTSNYIGNGLLQRGLDDGQYAVCGSSANGYQW